MDAEFKRKNDAQFKQLDDDLQHIGRAFIYFMAEDFTERTPGFGNQAPPNTKYIPTGRLRGGLNYTRAPIGSSSKGLLAGRNEQGPFSDYGRETLERITEQLQTDRMGGISYLENNVAYGYLIVMGMSGHEATGPRDWPKASQRSQETAARKAMQSLRSR